MLITLMFSVVAKKSRTFSTFSFSANEEVCRSRARQQLAQDGQWKYSIAYTSCSL